MAMSLRCQEAACSRPTYADTFNACIHFTSFEVDEAVRAYVETWCRRCPRCFAAVVAHLQTAIATQRMFQRVSEATRELVERAQRASRCTQSARLRRLQRRLVRHLWRPHGRLMRRDMRRALGDLACLA